MSGEEDVPSKSRMYSWSGTRRLNEFHRGARRVYCAVGTAAIVYACAPVPVAPSPVVQAPNSSLEAAYRQIHRRIVPFLFICAVFNYLDRINIGFARLQFMRDLGLTEAAYGLAAGLFYLGYIACEVPSNLLLHRIGARKLFLRIMVLWGLVSAGMSLVTTAGQLYVLRMMLGAAEAGAFPGIVLYLTYWFPAQRRAHANALFLMALPTAGVIGAPLSGWIMRTADGLYGLRGWQWMFIVEGIPAVILGLFAFVYLRDRPRDAAWLSAEEKQSLELELARQPAATRHVGTFGRALLDRRVYACAMAYFGVLTGANVLGFYTPTVIRRLGVEDVAIVGVLAAIPFLVALPAMYVLGRHSDRTHERRWHMAGALLIAATCFILFGTLGTSLVTTIALLAIAAAGIYGAMTVFWAIPPTYLSGGAAAGGIAFISSCGATAGFISPALIGWFTARTGNVATGVAFMGGVMVLSALALLAGIPASATESRHVAGQDESGR